jgi:hypothetical protein
MSNSERFERREVFGENVNVLNSKKIKKLLV